MGILQPGPDGPSAQVSEKPGALHTHPTDAPCIAVPGCNNDKPLMVASYDAVQRQRELQPLWARTAPAVENLTETPSRPWGAHIVDRAAYNAQMRTLLGLDQ